MFKVIAGFPLNSWCSKHGTSNEIFLKKSKFTKTLAMNFCTDSEKGSSFEKKRKHFVLDYEYTGRNFF